MKTIEIGFTPENLSAAAEYLMQVGAKPVIGKSMSQVEKLVKDAAIKKFKSAYEKKAVHPHQTNDGVLHGGIVWKGLSCIFSSVGLSSTPSEVVDVDIPNDLSDSLSRVEVDFYIYAGKS